MLNLYNIPNIDIKVENKDLNSLELQLSPISVMILSLLIKSLIHKLASIRKGKHTILNIDKFIEVMERNCINS